MILNLSLIIFFVAAGFGRHTEFSTKTNSDSLDPDRPPNAAAFTPYRGKSGKQIRGIFGDLPEGRSGQSFALWGAKPQVITIFLGFLV